MDFQSELLKVKKESDCEELATVDAYGDEEVATGWQTCLEEVFEGIGKVKVLGQEVQFTGFDIERDHAVVAVCKSGKKRVVAQERPVESRTAIKQYRACLTGCRKQLEIIQCKHGADARPA